MKTLPSSGLWRLLLCGVWLPGALLISGCGVTNPTTSTTTSAAVRGSVHGGIQPVVGATIQLFAAGNTGNGSQATLLAQEVNTDSQGGFSIPGTFTCSSANAPVYLVAKGGNPGFSTNITNPALIFLAALGRCGDLAANANATVVLNEVTTVAAVYALAPFLSAYDHLGASTTNTTGLMNAFLNAKLLADPATGMAPLLPGNLSVETPKIYALANALVPCVNSDGGESCRPLFVAATPQGGAAPTNVLAAALNIVRNPGQNVSAVFGAISSTSPFPLTLTSAPNDWTLSMTVTGGGLVEPTQLAIDGGGNVWVTNYGNPGSPASAGLVAFSPQGAPLAGSPFGVGLQTEAYGLSLDRNGDVWVTSAEANSAGGGTGSIAKFAGTNRVTPGAVLGTFADGTLSYPESIATDPAGSGTVLVANYAGQTVSEYDLSGNFLRNVGAGVPVFPVAITSDGAGGAWVGDQGAQNIVHILPNASTQAVSCCNGAQTVKLDLHGNVWVSNFFPTGKDRAFSFSEISPGGVPLLDLQGGGGLNSPGGGAVDAGGQFWVANYDSANGGAFGSFSEIAGNDGTVSAGTPLSPITGFGVDAKMSQPYTIAPDASGNLWVSVRNGKSIRMFFGLATPTATPATPLPQAP